MCTHLFSTNVFGLFHTQLVGARGTQCEWTGQAGLRTLASSQHSLPSIVENTCPASNGRLSVPGSMMYWKEYEILGLGELGMSPRLCATSCMTLGKSLHPSESCFSCLSNEK
ncbi:uncharacterized protein LOC144612875 [Panthera onca]